MTGCPHGIRISCRVCEYPDSLISLDCGLLRRSGKMAFCCTESDDKGAMVGENWLIPCNFRFERGKGLPYPPKNSFQFFPMLRVLDFI